MTAVSPLNIALTGLRVAQAQIAVTSNNIANVSTEGYSRKILYQYSNVIAEQGAGAATGNVERRINEVLLRDYRTQISTTSALQVRAAYMNQIQELHGPPDAEQAISNQIAKLKDSFAQLANQPESTLLINTVYTQAQQTAERFSAFSARLVEMRNNTQSEMKQSITTINSLSAQIGTLNAAIKVASTQQRSTAELEDQRDTAIRKLANEIDISYYKTEDNVVTVMTRQGQLLTDTAPVTLYFNSNPQGAGTYYPTSANGIMLGNPVTGTDLAAGDNVGGKLGELIRLRDETLPVYHAQIDELAHKMALRFQSQGLSLFTLPNGTIPANNPTSYVGFSADMVVNPDIVTDRTLIRKGTNPLSTVQTGSNEVLRKIVEFTFGDVAYQRGLGNVAITTGPATLFTELGINGQARIIGETNIQALGDLDDSPFINPGTEDTFSIQIGAGLPVDITLTAGMNATDLVNAINTAIPGTAQLSSGGQLILTAPDTITIAGGTLGANGLQELGLEIGVTAASPPSFNVAAGNNDPTTITILSTDTGTELLAKLNAVNGINATITVDGYLQIVPTEGGDISIVDGLGQPMAAAGVAITDIAHTAFNTLNVGPGANLDAGIQTATSIHDYAVQAVGLQSQNGDDTDNALVTEENYRAALERQFLDSSGVNLDEEMALLINIQTAYSASARTISVVERMLDELLNALA